MTIFEILVSAPLAGTMVVVMIIAVVGFSLLIAGLPFLIVNFYKNYKNQAKISLREILAKTYF